MSIEGVVKRNPLSGLRPRAFIGSVDTHLGKVLCRLLAQKDFEVWGSLREEGPLPKSLHRAVNKEDADIPIRQALLESDLLIFELVDGVDEATTALKLLMNTPYETEKTFILVSSVQTWAETKTNSELSETQDEEEDVTPADEEDLQAEQEPFTEDMYNKRVPHVKYTAWKEIEKLCKQANSATLHTYVVFAGLTYGEGEDKLHPIFKQAWHLGPEGLPIFGNGRNIVPTIHVLDLASFIWRLGTKEEPEAQRYFFGTDDGNATWNSIVKAINDSLGNGKTYKVDERDYILYENIEHFIINLKLEAGGIKSIMEEEDWVCQNGFVESIEKVVSEFRRERSVQPLRVAMLGPPSSGKTYLSAMLSQHYKLPHLTIAEVVKEFENQEVILNERVVKIKQKQREERRKQRAEERRQLKAERDAERQAQLSEQGENEDDEGEGQQEQQEEEEEELPETEEDDEDDEETVKIKERLNEIKLILNMKIKPKVNKIEEEELNKAKNKKPKPAMKGKVKKETPPATPPVEDLKSLKPRYTDKCLAIMYRWKMSQPECRNQGYILDGYPKTVAQAKLLLEEGELEIPEEGVEVDDDEVKDPEGEEAELRKVEDKLMVDFAVTLVATDEFLTERLMLITHQADHNNAADFQRRLDFYKANTKPGVGVQSYLESVLTNSDNIREISVREVRVDVCPMLPPPPPSSPLEPKFEDPAFKEIVEFIGNPHNYGPTPQEIESAFLEERRKEEEKNKLQEQSERMRKAREQKDKEELEQLRKEEAARLTAVMAQERQMLEVRKEPLKRYLMENVIPILTKGLVEVCEVRPNDPIDYLAEWLFRCNPQTTS